MNKRVAAIDLGTNTAHILIAEGSPQDLVVLYKERHYTFLAEHSIDTISEEAQERLKIALISFQKLMKEYDIQKVRLTGTEAFRKANNGKDILQYISLEYGWTVEIITGDEEATLIYKGVNSIINLSQQDHLIMDIGGGSVEFIITTEDQLIWQKSFPIGIAKLSNLAYVTDPLDDNVIAQLKAYINHELSPLILKLKAYPNITLIGAAGSFEILGNNVKTSNDSIQKIETTEFLKYLNQVIHLSPQDRAKLTWIPAERVKYVNMAIILINVAIEITQTQEILISPYALKEGIASELLQF